MYCRRKNSIGSQEIWAQVTFTLAGCVMQFSNLNWFPCTQKLRKQTRWFLHAPPFHFKILTQDHGYYLIFFFFLTHEKQSLKKKNIPKKKTRFYGIVINLRNYLILIALKLYSENYKLLYLLEMFYSLKKNTANYQSNPTSVITDEETDTKSERRHITHP